eukprot:26833-Rhodomonas_salina.2
MEDEIQAAQMPAVKDISDNKMPKGMEKWEEWLWMKMARASRTAAPVSLTFGTRCSTQVLGMSCAGKKQININEVDLLLNEQLDFIAKVFKPDTVDKFTEHLLMCTLIKIIKDGMNRPGAVGAAWKAANDRLILMQSKLTLRLVQ